MNPSTAYDLIYLVFAIALAGVYLAISWTAWKHRNVPAALALMVLVLASGEYSITYLAQLASHTPLAALFWYNLGILGASILGPGWLVFSLMYARQSKRISRNFVALLAVIPIFAVLASWTNDWHGLYAQFTFHPSTASTIVKLDFGLFYWVNFVYAYLTTSAGMLILIRAAWRRKRNYKIQTFLLITGTFIPILLNVLYVNNITLIPALDTAPFTFLITGVVWSLAIFRFQLLDLVPIAREQVLEWMPTGMLAFDVEGRLVDINAAGLQMVKQPAASLIGKPVPQYQALLAADGQAQPYQEVEVGDDPTGEYQGILVVPLFDDLHTRAGTLLLMQDITRRKQAELAEQEQRRLVEFLRGTAAELNHALLVDEVLDLMMKHIGQLVHCDGLNILLYDNIGSLVASHMRSSQPTGCGFSPEGGDENCPLRRMKRQGPPYLPIFMSPSSSIQPCTCCSGREAIQEALAVPVLSRGALSGHILLDWLSSDNAVQEPATSDRISSYLNQAVVALERAHLYVKAQTHNRRLELLNDITRTALESETLDNMLQTLADRLGEMFDADGAYITLWDDANQLTIPKAAYGVKRETYAKGEPSPGSTTLTGSVLSVGHVLVVEDVFHTPYMDPNIAAMYPSRSLLGIPLIAGSAKLGAALISFEQPHHFSQDEINLGEQAGRLVALAVDKERLLEAEHQQRVQSEAYRDELQHISNTDELTGLLNRRGLFLKAQMLHDWATQVKRPFGLTIFDLDNFKTINDTRGHAAGDQILRCIADVCRAGTRGQDLIGRYGGDEFVILFPEAGVEETCQVVERLRMAIAKETAAISSKIDLPVTISAGITAFDGGEFSLDDLLSAADQALYQGKHQGKNSLVVRSPGQR